ncbi:hypothetical protein JW960_18260 [candidate division KSB1 bacterium]|nr:hypothetical protein [candidate division KSB1 bacterium]
MTTRERFKAVVNFQHFDRLPIIEWAEWWDKTIERWHQEGLPATITDRYDICRHFGLDIYKQHWFSPLGHGCPEPPSHGAAIINSIVEYEDITEFLFPEAVIDDDKWTQWAREQQRGDVVLWFTLEGFFWFPRTLLGIEKHLYAFYEQPELLHRINSDLVQWMIKVVEELCTICQPDFMTFAEDMSYNNGPMLSKEHFDVYMRPYYDAIIPVLKKYDIIPIVDSDGDISMPLQWFEDAGIKGILPLERQAGVDIAELRRHCPNTIFIGHFNKMTMDKGESCMRSEFERLLPTAAHGGFMVSCDHQTPPGVSYCDYQLYLQLFREYAEKAGQLSHCELLK